MVQYWIILPFLEIRALARRWTFDDRFLSTWLDNHRWDCEHSLKSSSQNRLNKSLKENNHLTHSTKT
jgi:hypothetical protein